MHKVSTLGTLTCMITITLLSCNPKTSTVMPDPKGKLIELDAFPSSLVEPRPVTIWIPASYDSSKQYAVLYMQDGQMLFDSASTWTHQEWKVDETMSRMLAENTIRDAIVVGIYNSGQNRWAEYVPQAILDSIPPSSKDPLVQKWLNNKPQADQYLRFIVEELKPYMDSHYATLPDKANTFIMGSSMGGIISLYAICEYPEIFGGAGCLSTHWPLGIPGMEDDDITYDVAGEYIKYLRKHLPSPSDHRIYFDYGTATLDSLYRPYQIVVDAIMSEHGYTSKNWITREFPGEDHTERAWAKRLHIPLQFLLGKD
jgi:esterase/lipase superfamily enzyme